MQNKKKFDIEILYVLNLKKFNIITKVLHFFKMLNSTSKPTPRQKMSGIRNLMLN